ncbi:MAG: hypothetical protein Q4F99_04535 [bacterium]|nr:hypothetical protein [bacterium]
MLQIIFYPILLLLCAVFIFWWTRGMRMRCFNKAYPKGTQSCWMVEDALFLEYLEKAYRLPKGAAMRLPETTTPMELYLVLYPEHCIYDANENINFLRAFYPSQPVPMHSEYLTFQFRTLAQLWQDLQSHEA